MCRNRHEINLDFDSRFIESLFGDVVELFTGVVVLLKLFIHDFFDSNSLIHVILFFLLHLLICILSSHVMLNFMISSATSIIAALLDSKFQIT